MILDKLKEIYRTKQIKKQSEILMEDFNTTLKRIQFMTNQKKLYSLQLESFKQKLEQMLPEHAYKCYTNLDLACRVCDIEPPISLLELKNIKDYRVEQMLNDIDKDFE